LIINTGQIGWNENFKMCKTRYHCNKQNCLSKYLCQIGLWETTCIMELKVHPSYCGNSRLVYTKSWRKKNHLNDIFTIRVIKEHRYHPLKCMITISYEILFKVTIQLLHYEKRVQNTFYTKIIETSIPFKFWIRKLNVRFFHAEDWKIIKLNNQEWENWHPIIVPNKYLL
jgi:hypothetical protein